MLGREVTVRGDAVARLLPFPSVTFSDVSVAGETPDQPAMTVQTFSMDAELAPFMRGEILIFDMRLEKPRAVLRLSEDGQVNWALRPAAPPGVSQVTLERVTVSDGEIVLHHGGSGRTHAISAINAEISAKRLSGPWRLDGALAVDGEEMAVSVSTGQVGDDGHMRMRLRVDPKNVPVTVEADGVARFEAAAPHYAGTFSIITRAEEEETDSGPFRITIADDASGNDPGEIRADGEFAFDHRLLAVDAFRIETGSREDPYTAEGSAFVDIGKAPRFAIQAEGRQVRFDEEIAEQPAGTALSLSDRISALRTALQRLPKLPIEGIVDVALPAIIAGDTTVRDVRLSATPEAGGWAIRTFSADLPGRATLEAGGFLSTGADFGFRGDLLLAVGQPSGFAAWLSDEVGEAVRRLSNAGVAARVDLSERRQVFQNLELILGGAKFNGLVDRLQPDNARASATVELTGGALDLEGLAAFGALFVGQDGAYRFTDHDLDLKLKAGPVAIGGIVADSIDTALRLKDDKLDIDRLAIGGVAGATVSATGTIENFSGDPRGNLDASLVAIDLAPLIRLVAERYPEIGFAAQAASRVDAYPGLASDAAIDIVASLVSESDGTAGLAVSAQGLAGGTGFSTTLSAKGKPEALDEAEISLNVTALNEDAAALFAAYGLPALPLGLGDRAETGLMMNGSLANGFDIRTTFFGPGATLRFAGRGDREDGVLALKGDGSIEGNDVEPWLMATGYAFTGMGTGLPVSLRSPVVWSGGTLALGDLTGNVLDSAITGAVDLDVAGDLPKLSGALSVAALDGGFLAAMLFGADALPDAGETEWPDVPFRSGAIFPVEATLDMKAERLTAGSWGEFWDAEFKAVVEDGRIRLSGLTANAYGGEVDGHVELANSGGSGLLSTQLQLRGAGIDEVFAGTDATGQIDLSAALTATGKSLSGLVNGLSGSGTAAVRGFAVDGLSDDAFAPLLVAADTVGRDIDADATEGFAPEILRSGRFDVGDFDFAFTVAGGVARSAPLRLVTDKAAVAAELRADFNTLETAVEGEITYRAGPQALVGSDPAVGFAYAGKPGAGDFELDTAPMAQFLTQRALEREQARVQTMQAVLLEKQRLRREARYFRVKIDERQRAAEEVRRAAEEEARRAAEEAQAEERARAERRAADRLATQAAEEEARRAAERGQQVLEPLQDAVPAEDTNQPARLQFNETRLPVATPDAVERRTLPPVNSLPGVDPNLFGIDRSSR